MFPDIAPNEPCLLGFTPSGSPPPGESGQLCNSFEPWESVSKDAEPVPGLSLQRACWLLTLCFGGLCATPWKGWLLCWVDCRDRQHPVERVSLWTTWRNWEAQPSSGPLESGSPAVSTKRSGTWGSRVGHWTFQPFKLTSHGTKVPSRWVQSAHQERQEMN